MEEGELSILLGHFQKILQAKETVLNPPHIFNKN